MPDWRAEVRRRLAPLGLDPAREAEIAEELAQHLDDRYNEFTMRGVCADEARAAVLEELSSDRTLAEQLAAVEPAAPTPIPPLGPARAEPWLARIGHDLRYGARVLRARPLFTAIAILTLALGIGANSAMFSVVNAVLLRPLPYPAPDRLVTFWLTAPEKRLPVVPIPEGLAAAYGSDLRTVSAVGFYSSGGATLTGTGDPERINASAVTLDFFRTVGVGPMAGRTFTGEETRKSAGAGAPRGASGVAVISWRLWQRRYGGDPGIVGKSIDLSSEPTVVVGIMPRGFNYPDDADVWFPMPIDPESFSPWYLSAIARLKPGAAVADLRREVASVTDETMLRHPQRFPDAKRGATRVVAQTLARDLTGDARTPLLVLLGAVALVLLIAVANIANLLLARSAARVREMAVRCSLGASPRRIAEQLLTENLLLATLGAGAGLLLATWMLRLVRALPLEHVPRLADVSLDAPVMLFTAGVTVAIGLLIGLAPAARASRIDLQDALREGARAGASAAHRRLMNGFVVSQVALSLVLLVGAGLTLRSLRNVLAVDPGFRAEGVLVTRVWLPSARYQSVDQARQLFEALVARVSVLPGVRAAGLNDMVPLSKYNPQDEFEVEGQLPAPGAPIPVADIRSVTPGYFDAIGSPILRGRAFNAFDDRQAPKVVIVDEGLARRYWPGQDPIGKRIREGTDSTVPWRTVVGVTRAVKHLNLTERDDYFMYVPFPQAVEWRTYLVVRTDGDPLSLVTLIRRELAALDPGLPMNETHTMEQAVAGSLGTKRLTNTLLGGFALTAFLLAAIGIYGVMSLSVAGRRHEFGVRLALGAAPRDVLALVLQQGMRLAGLGLAIGIVVALFATRLLGSMLYDVATTDAITYVAVAAALGLAALVASYLPAKRATRSDPVAALRQE